MFWVGLIIGMLIGGTVCFVVMALCMAASKSDEYIEQINVGDNNGNN